MTYRFVSVGEAMIEVSGGTGGDYRLGFAGDTLNTAWYARALLPCDWQVDYVTALGNDIYSQQMRAFMAGNGIGTGHIQTIGDRKPGLYIIHQADGDRNFTYWRGASAARLMTEDRAAFRAGFEGADLVYFSGISIAILAPAARRTLLEAVADARRAGARTAFDPNIRPALWPSTDIMRDVLTQCAGVADIVLPTFADDAAVFGDGSPDATAARYRACGASEIVVKDGSNPALVVADGGAHRVDGQLVEHVVDATGAGDSFNAAYLAARQKGADPVESAHAAHKLAAQVIGQHGALIDHSLLGA